MMRSLFEAPAISVGELCRAIRSALRTQFPTRVRVFGEVSKARTIEGNTYFTLKDREGLIECYCYRDTAARLGVRLPLEDGTAVEVAGFLDIYERRSVYQLRVVDIVPVGKGALHLAFERLKVKLEAEGLFDEARKRAIPRFIRNVAIVTSRNSAVLHDFITTCRRRGAHIHIWLVHAPVSGASAAPDLARAIGAAGRLLVDVVVVARGGGSLEDLFAFNTEQVARAIAACAKPVIAAIGHETDFTIADFVADKRVATPTAAAEFVAQERDTLLARIRGADFRLRRALVRNMQTPRSSFNRVLRDLSRAGTDMLALRAQRYGEHVLHLQRGDPRRRLGAWLDRTRNAVGRMRALGPRTLAYRAETIGRLQRDLGRFFVAARALRSREFDIAAARLQAIDPRRTLGRGYAIVYDHSGRVLVDSTQVRIGEKIAVELKTGSLGALVSEKKEAHGQDRREEDTSA